MVNWLNGEPEVTPCVILIQEHMKYRSMKVWDAFMLQTAVKKYSIGIGKDNITGYTMVDYLLYYEGLKTSLTYPLIRIDQNGAKGVKCPSISGIKNICIFSN